MADRIPYIIREFDLSDLGEEWKGCYVGYRPAAINDLLKIANMSEQTDNTLALSEMLAVIRQQFVKGRYVIVGTDGKPEVVSMEVGDINLLPIPTQKDLFQVISGAAVSDPKDLPKVPPQDA